MKYKIIIYFILINCVINLSLVTAKENYNHKLIYFFNQLNPNTDPINKIKPLEYDRFYIDGVQHFQIFYNPINYRNYISKQINLNPIKKIFLNNDLGNLKQQQCSKNKIKKILVTDNNVEKKIRKFKETKKTKSINNLYIAEQTFLNFKRSVFKNSFLKSNNLKAYSTSEISADKKDMLFALKLVIPNNYNFIESNKSEVLTDIAVKIPKDINKYLKNINYRFNTTDIIEGEKNLSNFLNNISGNKILNVIYLFFEIPLDIFYNLEKNNAVNFIENINFSYIFYNDLNVIEDMSLDVSKKINFLFEKKKIQASRFS